MRRVDELTSCCVDRGLGLGPLPTCPTCPLNDFYFFHFFHLSTSSTIWFPSAEVPLSETESDADPFRQFARWFEQVRELEADPTAMALATATRDGRPSVRTVLLKGVDERGFVFYTNYRSRKAREIDETGRASLLFYWPSVVRQVRIDGRVEKVSEAESDAYFATRPLESRWSVYASRQSEVIESRAGARIALRRRARDLRRHRPAPALVGRLPRRPRRVRVLAGRPEPPARPAALPARGG